MPVPWILYGIFEYILIMMLIIPDFMNRVPPCRVFGGFIGFRFELLYFYSALGEVESKFM